MNAAQGRPPQWATLCVLLVGLLLLSGRVLASDNGETPVSLACPSGQVTWLEGRAAPGHALLARFAGVAVGGGSSDAGGYWRIPLQVSASAGVYPVEVIEREGGEQVAAFTCYVDLPIGATPTGTPTRRPTQPPSPSSPAITTTRSPTAILLTWTATLPTPTASIQVAAPTVTEQMPSPSASGSVETATTFPTAQTPTSTSPPTSQSTVALIVAQADDPGDGELFEYIILENQSSEPQNPVGWRLVQGRTGESYTFPSVTLLPGEQLVVWSGAGEDEPTSGSLFWPAQSPRWVEGDAAKLHDAAGQVVSTLLVQSPEGDEE